MNKINPLDINTIVTHSGSFHADEIMAIVLLDKFFLSNPLSMSINNTSDEQVDWINKAKPTPEHNVWFSDGIKDCRQTIKVIRSREAKLLKDARKSKNTFVIDVGGELNSSMLNFDHHQKSMTKTWNDKTPLSSTGLIWNWLKEHQYLNELSNKEIKDIEEQIVKPLDKHDNGVATSQIALHASLYNRTSDNADEQAEQFFKAFHVMSETFDNVFYNIQMKLKAEKVLKKRWEVAKSINSTVVLLSKPIEYKNCSNLLNEISHKEADILIIPGQGNRFSIKSLSKEEQFSIKCPCPKEWRGKTDIKLKSGKKELLIKFCHKTGFMCVVEGSHKDAVYVANYIVKNNQFNNKNNTKKKLKFSK